MQQNTIALRLNITEVNVIIKALSEKPFREVYELIGKIHAQSNAQLKSSCTQLQTNKSIDTHDLHDKV
ncbi:hypothetical protein ACRRVA_02140 [Candidatus Cardinium hertigii]|uniref:hypothetical protein n=1 Tax=Candidatus Cardinium TaxID=273135 RepID=UPI00027EA185|nr:hypothetical protein [Cardinium endosymbiont of Encarsia pergandiella]CCM10162.1 Putative uncharacterized protein [Cardinium endosymbiont cEper1 of Encarsia pergandiella]